MAIDYTTRLDIVKIDQNQAKKEVTANEGFSDLADSLSEEFSIDLSSAADPFTVPYTPQAATPDTTALRAIKYRFFGALGSVHDVIHPAKRHFFWAENATTGGFTVTVKVSGQTGTNIAGGDSALLYCNGTDVFEITVGAGSVSAIDDLSDVDTSTTAPVNNNRLTYDGANWVPEAEQFKLVTYTENKPNPSQQVLKYTFVEDVDFPVDLAASRGHSDVAATAISDYDVLKNAVSIGTISFAASATTPTFTLSGGVSFIPGDRLTVTAPSPQDAGLSGISITLLGSRAA